MCIGVVALTMSLSSAEACRVPTDPEAARIQQQRQHKETAAHADIIVKGRLFNQATKCDPSRHCGEWIQTSNVSKGASASYYLIDPNELVIACSREWVGPGMLGTFHLKDNGNGMYLILDDIR